MEARPQDWVQESENLHEGGDWTELRLISVATNGPTEFSKYYPETMELLNEKKAMLKAVEDRIQALQEQFEATIKKKEDLEKQVEDSCKRLDRAFTNS